jgi:photosystem II stability/assembly factor-like uncharacterized protein
MKRILKTVALLAVCVYINSCDMPTKQEDKVDQWEPISNTALSNLTIQTIAVTEQSVNTVYVGTFDGVFKSTDTGETWKYVSTGLTSKDITSICIDPQDINIVYCGSWGKGVFATKNGGESWASIWQGNDDPRISQIACTSSNGNSTVFAATENGVFKTSDLSLWEKSFAMGRILSIATSPVDAQTLFIGVRYKGNYRSTDIGESWNDVNTGMHATSDGIAAANSFAFSYNNTNQVVLSTGWVDLFKTLDNGDSWQKFAKKIEHLDIVSVASDKRKPQMLWAATTEQGIYKSEDNGDSWQQFNEGLGSLTMKTISVISGSKSVIYAGTIGGGIYKYVMD